jgi:signal transduction histidine kinase
VEEAAASPAFPKVQFAAEGSAAPLLVDESLLQRAVTNLVTNAAEACERNAPPGGRVTVSIAEDGERRLAISVHDTGPGMTPERLRALFTRDFQSDRRGSGVGLGLGVARHIALAHGGEVTAESRPGEGSVFRISVPRRTGPPPGTGQTP